MRLEGMVRRTLAAAVLLVPLGLVQAPLATPAAASCILPVCPPPTNFVAGGGYVNGWVNFIQSSTTSYLPPMIPTPIPTDPNGVETMLNNLDSNCPASAWTFQNIASGGAAYTQAQEGWTGPFNGSATDPSGVTANGGSTAECYSGATGTFNVSAVDGSLFTGNVISCTNLDGTYQRHGAIVVATLLGTCKINQLPTESTSMHIVGTLLPSPLSPGSAVITPLQQAVFNGGWTSP